MGIIETLKSICNAKGLYVEYCRDIVNKGYQSDCSAGDDLSPEAEEARLQQEGDDGGRRFHEQSFHKWSEPAASWDLCVDSIDEDVVILPLTQRMALDTHVGLTTTFRTLSDTETGKRSKLLTVTRGVTNLNFGIDAMMLDALQPYKRLIERLQTQNGPIGNKIGHAHVHKNLSYIHSPTIGHRVCGWFQEMYDEINDIFLGDTPTFGRHFNDWRDENEGNDRYTLDTPTHKNALLDTHTFFQTHTG